jgi:hypothetical protein
MNNLCALFDITEVWFYEASGSQFNAPSPHPSLREYMRFLNLVHMQPNYWTVFLFVYYYHLSGLANPPPPTIQAARGLKVSSGSVWPPMPALGMYFFGKVENQSV